MKRRLKPLIKALVSVTAASAALYLGRVLGLYLLARAFRMLNLTMATYPLAPGWMRFLADNTDALANLTGLLVGSCALILLRGLFPPAGSRFKTRFVIWFIVSALLGFGLVLALRLADELRQEPGTDYLAASVAQGILWALFAFVQALFLRGCISEGFRLAFGRRTALIMSALSQAAVFVLVFGGLGVLPVLNGLITGALFWRLYEKTHSLWPETLASFGFLLGSRVTAGYPDGPVYAVSRSVWTGFGTGLESSLIFMFILAALAAFSVRGRIRSLKYASKNAVHRKSLRRKASGSRRA